MAERDERGRLKKGSTANRNGRPKKEHSITELVRKNADIEVAPGQTYADAISRKLLELAADGDMAAIKYTMDRLDGTPKQSIDSNVDSVLQIKVNKADGH